jgi:uncharacterized protein (TIGR03663 family)
MKRPSALFAVSILGLAAAALAIRLPRLAARPMHCDEANQAVRAGLLWETGVYEYDPKEHHGPTLYWLTLPSLWASGAKDFGHSTEFTYRIVPVVFGVGLIVLSLLVADGLGRGPAILAAFFTAISPAMVFYSRYYVQEMLLVFFTFAAIACGWRYVRSRSIGWAVAAGASFGLMHATKETWILAAAAMVIGLALTIVWTLLGDAAGRLPKSARLRKSAEVSSRSREGEAPAEPETGRGGPCISRSFALPALRSHLRPVPLLAAVVAAGGVAVAFYSSFDEHWLKGPLNSILAYGTYFQRGTDPGIHRHPWFYYLSLLVANRPAKGFFWTEGLIVGLAAVGFVSALLRRTAPGFGRFLALYTLVLTVLYCAIPYKTPWCLLSFFHGMILLAGVGAWAILRWLPGIPLKGLICILLAAGAGHLARECCLLNFNPRYYADYRNPYVYAHTSTDLLNLAARMERLAQLSPEGHDMVVHVVTPDNSWPLPWYLRKLDPHPWRQLDHRNVGYWQDPAKWANETAMLPPPSVIILTPDVQEAVTAGLRAAYNQQMMFGLRPEVFVSVWVREDLWQAFLSDAVGKPGRI